MGRRSAQVGDPVGVVLDRLRSNGGRVTTARRVLLETLFSARGHCTAEDLASAVQQRAPEVHLSTIYRNLDELERLGVIEHVHLGHGPATYHLAGAVHAHLMCSSCGETVEAPDELFADLSAEVRQRYGFRLNPRHFAMVGLCRRCAATD